MARETDERRVELRAWLDERGIGKGELELQPLGDGHSNLTYTLRRDDGVWVLRRPPEGPIAATAHDVLREARWMRALGPTPVPVPEVLATCEEPDLIGAPFFVMELLEGHVPVDSLPAAIDNPVGRRELAYAYVDALAALHVVDVETPGIAEFQRPGSYLDRQLKRFSQMWERNKTREIPAMERIADWLAANKPTNEGRTVVHGDARIGNAVFTAGQPVEVVGLLDWELAAVGDPLADIGYMLAIWPEPDEPDDPLLVVGQLSRRPGFPSRAEMVQRYAVSSGADVEEISFYEVLALWKAVVIMEGNYRRYREGTTAIEFFATYEQGLPQIAVRAELLGAEPARR